MKLFSSNYYKDYLIKYKYFFLFIFIISLFRIIIGMNYPISISMVSPLDDLLFIKYSDLITHFTSWNYYSLVKDMGYPIFLAFVNFTHISYRFWLSLIWVISGLLVIFGIKNYLTENRFFLIITFVFIIFSPIAFDAWSGTRIYRNSIMAPFSIIFLASLFIFINKTLIGNYNNKELLFWGIITGLIFSFNFYIKEDGITILPIFISCILISLIFIIFNQIKNKELDLNKFLKLCILILLPVIIFSIITVTYEEVNMHYFGVSEINTRTEGEIGQFWKNLLLIEDSNKTNDVWVPASTIEKAIEASPTLKSNKNLTNDILHSNDAQGNLRDHPISGDLVAWALRNSINHAGLFKNESTADNFFKQVNAELKNSFDNGSLKKSPKIFITGSLDGKSMDDIQNLVMPYFILGIKECLFYKDLRFGDYPIVASPQQLNDIQNVLNDEIKNVDENSNLLEKFSLKFGYLTINFYQIISYFVVLLSVLSFIFSGLYQIKNKFKNRHINIALIFEIFVIGTFLVQVFAISWFCVWIPLDSGLIMKFYTVANQGFFALFEVLSIATAFSILSRSNRFHFDKFI